MMTTFSQREIELITLAHEAGRDYVAPGIAEAADDLHHAPTLAPPEVSYEVRVAERVAQMEHLAKMMPERLAEYARRCRADDRQLLEAALKAGPVYRGWAHVHACVDRAVWARIWSDLAPSTKDAHLNLMPPGWRRGLAGGAS
jgi:hypothetical protein